MFLYFFELKNSSSRQLMASLSGVSGCGLFTLYQLSYKGFKGVFVKLLTLSHNSTLLEGFPLYWTRYSTNQSALQIEDMRPGE